MQRKPTMESLEKGYCIFCRTNKCDEQKLGQMYSSQSLVVHYFCLLFASGLSQNGSSDKEGIMGFLPHDIMKEVRRAARLKCTYCKGIGATIGCVMSKCRIVFHLPCGLENGAMNQFMGEFRSFCESHRPRQKMLSRDSEISESVAASICIICMSNISMRPSNTVLHMPCCKNSWFHRDCLQNHAVSSGLHFFRCPLCNDKDIFQKEMLKFGIYIPDQDAAWEREPNAFQDLLIRYSQCDVDCMCPHGREYERISSKWEVVLCDWCGSSGTHIACSRLKGPSDDWICKDCFQICGKDKTKGKKKADSCPKVVERPKSRPSIDHTPSNSKKRQRSKLDSFGEGRKSRKRSRLVTERKDVGRSVLQRRYSQPQISDHVVLGSRLNDWTPEERKLGYQAQLHLTKMTHDTIVKAKAALSRRARKTVGYHQICIEQAFSRKNDIKNNTKDGANQRRSVTISDCVRNVFSKFTKGLKTDAALLNSDAPILMNGGRDVVKPDSAIIMDAKNEAVKHSGAMVDCIKEAVVSESAVQMVAPGGKPSAAEFADVPCNIAAAEADNSSSTGVNAGAMIQSANVPDIDLEAGDKAHFAGSEVLATVTNTLCGSVKRAIIRLHPTGLSPAKKHVNVKPMKRSLSYPEFVNKYFETSHPSVLAKVMYYQDYLRKGLLPDFLNSTAY